MLFRNSEGQVADSAVSPSQEPDDSTGHLHRQSIGLLGVLLPFLVVIIARFRPTAELPGTHLLNSISAYYYTGAVAIFVGILTALSVFLLTYRGYANDAQSRDRWAARVAGTTAALAAFFPTNPPIPGTAPEWWTETTGTLHLTFAGILFASFIYFSLFLFPKTRPGRVLAPRDKKMRNAFYYLCGAGMVGCIVWILFSKFVSGRSIFWPEALALEFFGLSWLVKGRADRMALGLAKRLAGKPARPRSP